MNKPKLLNEISHIVLGALAVYCILSPVPVGATVAAGIYVAWLVIKGMRKWDKSIRMNTESLARISADLAEYRELLNRRWEMEYQREKNRAEEKQRKVEKAAEKTEMQKLYDRLPEAIQELESRGYKVEEGNPYHYADEGTHFVPLCKVTAPTGEPEYCQPLDLVKYALLEAPSLTPSFIVEKTKWQASLEKRFVIGLPRTETDEFFERTEKLHRESAAATERLAEKQRVLDEVRLDELGEKLGRTDHLRRDALGKAALKSDSSRS